MSVKSYLSHAVAKPLFAGLVAGLGDHYIMQNPHYQLNAQFAGAVGAGIFLASNVEQAVSPFFPTATPIGHIGKALEGRIVEIACGSAGALALQKFVLKKVDAICQDIRSSPLLLQIDDQFAWFRLRV